MFGVDWPLWVNIAVFLASWSLIAVVGFRLGGLADLLAARTGLGQGLVGGVFLAGSTSLPGLIVSVAAGYSGRAELAISNAVGGIAGQTFFLVVADLFFRRVNLENAADDVSNLITGALLIALLGATAIAGALPGWNLELPGSPGQIDPVSPLLIAGYLGGIYLANRSRKRPQWLPRLSRAAPREEAPADGGARLGHLWARFAVLAALTAGGGVLVAVSGAGISTQTGLGDTLVGALLTGLSTSTPEALSTIAAARRNAADLAVGNILGSNAFDVLFAAVADFAYPGGSIYEAMTAQSELLVLSTVVMTAVLMMGLLHRQERGPLRIGFESLLVAALYGGTVAVIALG